MKKRSQITGTVTLAVILTTISGILGNAVPLPAFVKENIWLLLLLLGICLLALIFLQVREQLAKPGRTPELSPSSPQEASGPFVQARQSVSSSDTPLEHELNG